MKYIFIDSNQYRHIFSKSEGFSDDVYNLLLKLIDNDHVQLLIPQQTKDEVERNRFHDWPEQEVKGIENKINSLNLKREHLDKEFADYDSKKIKKSISEKIKILNKEKNCIPKKFTNLKSKQNQKIKVLFDKAIYIPDSNELLENAEFRFKKGNPPYDNEKFGDALIWESILLYLKKQRSSKPELIFVASDKRAWGDVKFHLWLEREFKFITKGKIYYSKKLSDIPGLTKEEQEKIRKKEINELKENAINDFINSDSFIGAGKNARRLLQYKSLLSDDDYKKIFIASLRNHEIYQSWFTADSINILFDDGKGYVVSTLERATPIGWEKFCNFYNCQLKRNVDEARKGIDIEDVPF